MINWGVNCVDFRDTCFSYIPFFHSKTPYKFECIWMSYFVNILPVILDMLLSACYMYSYVVWLAIFVVVHLSYLRSVCHNKWFILLYIFFFHFGKSLSSMPFFVNKWIHAECNELGCFCVCFILDLHWTMSKLAPNTLGTKLKKVSWLGFFVNRANVYIDLQYVWLGLT